MAGILIYHILKPRRADGYCAVSFNGGVIRLTQKCWRERDAERTQLDQKEKKEKEAKQIQIMSRGPTEWINQSDGETLLIWMKLSISPVCSHSPTELQRNVC